jgi:pilus assembly protein CpaE
MERNVQDEVARIVLALESPEVAEEVMHFLDRSGRARVVGTAVDERQLSEAVKQLEPDAVVAAPSLVPARGELNGSALLAVDTSQSVATLRRALRAGASGFFLWPAEREDLAIAAGRARPAFDAGSADQARVVAVCGARGGIGATFVATHLARAFGSAQDRRCIVIDLDAALGDLVSVLGVAEDGVRTMCDLVPLGEEIAAVHVSEIVWRHPDGFGVVFAADADPANRIRPREDHVRAVVAAARRLCDVVIVCVPRSLDPIARTGMDVADRVAVVVGLDVLSLRGAKRLIETAELAERAVVVVNRASRSDVTPADVERALGIAPAAVIPADGRVGSAQQRGRLVPSRGRLGRQLQRLADGLLEERP